MFRSYSICWDGRLGRNRLYMVSNNVRMRFFQGDKVQLSMYGKLFQARLVRRGDSNMMSKAEGIIERYISEAENTEDLVDKVDWLLKKRGMRLLFLIYSPTSDQ